MNILGIDLGSTQTCAILAQKDEDGHLNIIGSGKARTQGVKKGAITNIELASKSISQAAKEAQIVAGVSYDKVIVSVFALMQKALIA